MAVNNISKRRSRIAGIALWSSAIAAGYFGYEYALDQRFAVAQEQRETVRQGLAQAADLSTAFRHVGKVVEPSVVSIQVRKKASNGMSSPQFDEDMLRRFFPDRDGDGEPDLPRGFDPEQMPEQMG